MAKKRSQRMNIVLQLAERAEQTAADALQAGRQQVEQAEQQLQQVNQYQQEYILELNQKRQGLHAQAMINERLFLQQLGEAESVQQQRLAQLRQAVEQALNNWQVFYQRRKNIEKLIGRLRNSEDMEMDKCFQKELDELSTTAFSRPSQR